MSDATLMDLCEFVLDGTHGSPARAGTGVPVLSAQNVIGGTLDWDTQRFTTEHEYAVFRRRINLRSGDVLLTIVGTIGRAAVVTDVRPAVFQRSVAVIRPRADRLDSRYLYWAFESLAVREQLRRMTNQSSQAGVYLKRLGALRVQNPPLAEQRRITAMLDKADGVRRKRRETLKLLDEFLRSAFLEMFGDPVRNEKGWEVVKLGSIGDVQSGLQVSHRRTGLGMDVPYLRVANVFRDRLDLSEVKRMGVTPAEFERTRLREGDILLVEGHGNADEIGRSAVWDATIESCTHQNHLIRVRLKSDSADPHYVSVFLNSAGGRRQLVKSGKTTSGLNTISTNNVKSVEIMLPPHNLQKRFDRVRRHALSTAGRAQVAGRATDELFDCLADRTFATF